MRLLVAIILVVIGAAQISDAKKAFSFGPFLLRSEVGRMPHPYKPTKEDMLASSMAVQHFEFFRRFMHSGIGHIPPMDPYKENIEHRLVFSGRNADFNGTIYVSNLEVMGASAVTVRKLEVYLKTKRLDFTLTIPRIVAKAHFSAVNIMFNGLVFNTSGEMEVKMNNYDLSGAVSVVVNRLTNRYKPDAVIAQVAATSGQCISSVEIGDPSHKDINDVRQAMFDAVTAGFMQRFSEVLLGYPIPQIDKFMRP